MPEIEVVIRIFVFPNEVMPHETAEQVAEDMVLKGLEALSVEIVECGAVEA